MDNIKMPVNRIGEPNWIENLTTFLASYDVETSGIEAFNNAFNLPDDMVAYYKHFGGIDSSDFMYNLYRPDQLINLSQSKWAFVSENFDEAITRQYIVFAESPGNDPVCFNKKDFSIWLFSHDPLQKAKVFENFNQYLKYEIIELQKLMGDVDFEEAEELSYHQRHLSGENINIELRRVKFL